jgi:A/G-specific adenine glycosylase
LAELGLAGSGRGEIATLHHQVTRYRITMVCLDVLYKKGRFSSPKYAQGLWVRPSDLAQYPLSAPQRRLAARLAALWEG